MLTKFIVVINLQYTHRSLCSTPETNILFYIKYISIKTSHEEN